MDIASKYLIVLMILPIDYTPADVAPIRTGIHQDTNNPNKNSEVYTTDFREYRFINENIANHDGDNQSDQHEEILKNKQQVQNPKASSNIPVLPTNLRTTSNNHIVKNNYTKLQRIDTNTIETDSFIADKKMNHNFSYEPSIHIKMNSTEEIINKTTAKHITQELEEKAKFDESYKIDNQTKESTKYIENDSETSMMKMENDVTEDYQKLGITDKSTISVSSIADKILKYNFSHKQSTDMKMNSTEEIIKITTAKHSMQELEAKYNESYKIDNEINKSTKNIENDSENPMRIVENYVTEDYQKFGITNKNTNLVSSIADKKLNYNFSYKESIPTEVNSTEEMDNKTAKHISQELEEKAKYNDSYKIDNGTNESLKVIENDSETLMMMVKNDVTEDYQILGITDKNTILVSPIADKILKYNLSYKQSTHTKVTEEINIATAKYNTQEFEAKAKYDDSNTIDNKTYQQTKTIEYDPETPIIKMENDVTKDYQNFGITDNTMSVLLIVDKQLNYNFSPKESIPTEEKSTEEMNIKTEKHSEQELETKAKYDELYKMDNETNKSTKNTENDSETLMITVKNDVTEDYQKHGIADKNLMSVSPTADKKLNYNFPQKESIPMDVNSTEETINSTIPNNLEEEIKAIDDKPYNITIDTKNIDSESETPMLTSENTVTQTTIDQLPKVKRSIKNSTPLVTLFFVTCPSLIPVTNNISSTMTKRLPQTNKPTKTTLKKTTLRKTTYYKTSTTCQPQKSSSTVPTCPPVTCVSEFLVKAPEKNERISVTLPILPKVYIHHPKPNDSAYGFVTVDELQINRTYPFSSILKNATSYQVSDKRLDDKIDELMEFYNSKRNRSKFEDKTTNQNYTNPLSTTQNNHESGLYKETNNTTISSSDGETKVVHIVSAQRISNKTSTNGTINLLMTLINNLTDQMNNLTDHINYNTIGTPQDSTNNQSSSSNVFRATIQNATMKNTKHIVSRKPFFIIKPQIYAINLTLINNNENRTHNEWVFSKKLKNHKENLNNGKLQLGYLVLTPNGKNLPNSRPLLNRTLVLITKEDIRNTTKSDTVKYLYGNRSP